MLGYLLVSLLVGNFLIVFLGAYTPRERSRRKTLTSPAAQRMSDFGGPFQRSRQSVTQTVTIQAYQQVTP